MEQVKFYKYATIFLVILNISMVAFFFLTKPKGIPPRGNKNAIEILKLDKTQKDTFLQYADIHKSLMKGFNKEQKALLKTYFQTLTDTTNIAITDSLLTEVQALERKKIESTYEHLAEIKIILNEEQEPRYQQFMNRVYRMILAEGKKK
ncbi:MAG: hypothetical protein AB8G11_24325 [Saprospiraceae bacterium]